MGVFATWKARLFVGVPICAGIYQFGCDQLDWPKLPVLWGMTGAHLPWWGWLLIAQTGFVFALFEYIRRANISSPSNVATPPPVPVELLDQSVARKADLAITDSGKALAKVAKLEKSIPTLIRAIENLYLDSVIKHIEGLAELKVVPQGLGAVERQNPEMVARKSRQAALTELRLLGIERIDERIETCRKQVDYSGQTFSSDNQKDQWILDRAIEALIPQFIDEAKRRKLAVTEILRRMRDETSP